jgi:hypothetical protein
MCVHSVLGAVDDLSRGCDPRFAGIPPVWQSMQRTKCMLWGLRLAAKVVFIFVTSSRQFEIAG